MAVLNNTSLITLISKMDFEKSRGGYFFEYHSSTPRKISLTIIISII